MRMTSQPTRRPAAACGAHPGFTLVEILIVVVILAILAAIVMPQFTSATDEARENALAANVWRVRQQLELYKQTHGRYPDFDGFVDQLTQASNEAGQTATPDTPGYAYGPYLNAIPRNPYTGTNDVGNGEVGTSAWHYDEQTGAFHANHAEEYREM